MAAFYHPRVKDDPLAQEIAEVGDIAEGNGCKVTLLPHYLLVEIVTSEDEGDLWIPMSTLLALIGEIQQKTGN